MTYANLTTKKARVAYIREMVGTNASWAIRALTRIYAAQTTAEQAIGTTTDHNGVGFTGADSEILSSFAEQYNRRGSLSPKQMIILHNKMPKYARQLMESAEVAFTAKYDRAMEGV